jgi:hypothetical protein
MKTGWESSTVTGALVIRKLVWYIPQDGASSRAPIFRTLPILLRWSMKWATCALNFVSYANKAATS